MISLLRRLAHLLLGAAQWLAGPGRELPVVGAALRFIGGLMGFVGAFFALLEDLWSQMLLPLAKRLRPASLTDALPLIFGVLGAALIALILYDPTGQEPPPPPEPESIPREERETYPIGALLSLTGKNEAIGNQMRRGYDIAVEAINAGGGIIIGDAAYNLGLVIYDDESSPVRATETAELMFSVDQPPVLLAPYSSLLALPAIRVARERRVPVVAAVASSAGLGNLPNGVFLLQTPPVEHLRAAAEIFVEHVARRRAGEEGGDRNGEPFINGEEPRVALVASADAFAQQVVGSVALVLADAGIEDLILIDPALGDEDFSAAAEVLAEVDALFISAFAQGALRTFEEIGEKGYNIPFVALTHCSQARLTRSLPTVSEGALCAIDWLPDAQFAGSAPLEGSFASAYRKRYGENPTYHAAAAAAAIQVIAAGIVRSAGVDSNLGPALGLTSIKTIYGPIEFGGGGINTAKPMVLAQISQARYIPVVPPELARQEIDFERPQLGGDE